MDKEHKAMELIVDSVLLAIYKNEGMTDKQHQAVIADMFNSIIEVIDENLREEFVDIFNNTMQELIDVQVTADHVEDIMKQLSWRK